MKPAFFEGEIVKVNVSATAGFSQAARPFHGKSGVVVKCPVGRNRDRWNFAKVRFDSQEVRAGGRVWVVRIVKIGASHLVRA